MEDATILMFLHFHLILAIFLGTCLSGTHSGSVYDNCERQGFNITDVEKGIIRSERYPSMYPPNRFCIWRIVVKPSQTLRITVLDVDLDDTQGIDHCVEYVSIFSPHSRINHNTECGKIDEQKIIDIDDNIVEIWFHSSENKTQDKRGFQIEFSVVGCEDISSIEGATLKRVGNVTEVRCNEGEPDVQEIFCVGTTWHPAPHPIICKGFPTHSDCQSEPVSIIDSKGYIHSPNFPDEYPPDRLCVWRLGDHSRRSLRITIQTLSLTPTDFITECRDYLGIYELTRGDPVTDIHCHSQEKAVSVVVGSGLVDILFESRERPEDKTPGKGFLIYYEAIGCEKIIPPSGATVEGLDNETVVTCADGREFTLSCVEGEWSPPSSSISCWSVSGPTAAIEPEEITTEAVSTENNDNISITSSTSEGTSNYIPTENDKKEHTASESFPLLPIIIGVVSVFILLILAVLIFIFCRRKRLHQRIQEDEDTLQITDPENYESEPRPTTDVTGNGNAVTNGHLVTQVHYIRPTKRGSKKNKDATRNKRTSYHLTVADDETAMIDNENYSGPNHT